MSSRKVSKVIAHFLDGSLIKGTSPNFSPTRAKFDLEDVDGVKHSIHIKELKALFFVRSFEGRLDRHPRQGFFADETGGNKVMIEFFDGEVLFGYSEDYVHHPNGFFMTPGDPDSNNERVFVVHSSTKRSKFKPASNKKRKAKTGAKRKKRRQPA
ncbi:MAG: hypothetical protein O7D32_08140 [bacterium]|nr:hypothetical protein [bacterium]